MATGHATVRLVSPTGVGLQYIFLKVIYEIWDLCGQSREAVTCMPPGLCVQVWGNGPKDIILNF